MIIVLEDLQLRQARKLNYYKLELVRVNIILFVNHFLQTAKKKGNRQRRTCITFLFSFDLSVKARNLKSAIIYFSYNTGILNARV